MNSTIYFSAITGTYCQEERSLSYIGHMQAWWERFVYDYRVRAEGWKMWFAYVFLRVLQILGRAPTAEKMKSFIESEEKK